MLQLIDAIVDAGNTIADVVNMMVMLFFDEPCSIILVFFCRNTNTRTHTTKQDLLYVLGWPQLIII